MHTATLGRTGVGLTRLGLGCAPIGDLLGTVGDTTAREVMQSAWDAGIRYFDTSPFYGHGKSEHRLGEFLRGRPRDQFKVSTKVGRVLRPTTRPDLLDQQYWHDPLPFTLHFDYSYDGIMRSYEDSLQRLGLGSVDLLVIHDLDQMFHHSEARIAALMQELATSGWRALDQLRASGAVAGVGAGINFVGLIPRFLDLVEPDFFPGRPGLQPARPRRAGPRLSTLRRGGRGDHRRRPVRLRHPGHRGPRQRHLPLRRPAARGSTTRAGDGGGVHPPRRRPGHRRAAVPACPPAGGRRHPRRRPPRSTSPATSSACKPPSPPTSGQNSSPSPCSAPTPRYPATEAAPGAPGQDSSGGRIQNCSRWWAGCQPRMRVIFSLENLRCGLRAKVK